MRATTAAILYGVSVSDWLEQEACRAVRREACPIKIRASKDEPLFCYKRRQNEGVDKRGYYKPEQGIFWNGESSYTRADQEAALKIHQDRLAQ